VTGSQLIWRSFVTGLIAGVVMAVVAFAILRGPDVLTPAAGAPPSYSDQPASAALAALSCSSAPGDTRLQIDATNIDLPDSFETRVAQGAEVLHARWSAWLNDRTLVPAPVRIRYLADQEQFVDLYQGPALGGARTSGFYRMRDNEAIILYSPFRRSDTLATTLHELSHLFTAWHLGATPAWLNEGLAEHFETLDRRGDFPPSAEHVAVLRRDGATPLSKLLDLGLAEFSQAEARRRYASAWSLIAFLLESEEGTSTLQALLQEAHAQRCAPKDNPSRVLGTYPGGLRALEQNWLTWVRTL